jgi:hypothetical protein
VLKPAFQFLNRDRNLAAASDDAKLVPYVLVEEVARDRKRLGGFVYGESEARHYPLVLGHGANLPSAASGDVQQR